MTFWASWSKSPSGRPTWSQRDLVSADLNPAYLTVISYQFLQPRRQADRFDALTTKVIFSAPERKPKIAACFRIATLYPWLGH